MDRLVKVILLNGSEVKGRVKDASETSATIDEMVVNFTDIKRATLEIEFKQVGK
jgi:ribosome maturation factor RimP